MLQAQDDLYKIRFTDKELTEVLDFIEREYQVLLSYKDLDIKTQQEKISVNISAESKEELLIRLLDDLKINYKEIDNNQWVLTSKKEINKCGRILDELTGQALAFANIISSDASLGLSTDEDGFFLLPPNLKDDQEFKVSYVGFEEVKFNIGALTDCIDKEDYMNNPANTNIKLKVPAFSIPFLLIKDYITDGIDLDQNGFSTRLKPRRQGVLPGQVDPDVMKSIQFLPGISSPSARASDIYIRGGTPDQNLILWEDIPIYHTAHYFGMISAVDPYVISEMNVFRGGFDASYGGRAAGVIDIKSFGLESDKSFLGGGSDMVNTYIYGHQSLGKKENNSLTFSFRRSYAELWESPTFKSITRNNQQGLVLGNVESRNFDDRFEIKNDFNFFDTHVKFSSQVSKNTKVDISGIYASNDFIDDITDIQVMQGQKDTVALQNAGISFKLKHQWSERFSSEIKGIATKYSYDYHYKVKEIQENDSRINGFRQNNISDKQIHIQSVYQLRNQKTIDIGYQLTDYDISFDVNEMKRGKQDVKQLGNSSSQLHAAFASFKNPIQKKVGIDAGLRLNYYSLSREYYIEPRIKLSYQLIDGLSLHANYGKHHQFVGQVTKFRGSEIGISNPIWQLSENKSIPIVEADQIQAGLIYAKNDWVLDLQVYRRDVIGLSSRSYEFENEINENASVGKSKSNGFDVLVKKRISKELRLWASYTYAEIEMNFKEIAPVPFPSDFDQRHSFKFSGQYRKEHFQFAGGFNFGTGLPYTRVEDFKIIDNPNEPIIYDVEYGRINAHKLGNTMEINLSSQYELKLKRSKWKAFISGSITNLLDKSNVYNRSFYIDNPPMLPAKEIPLDKLSLLRTYNLSLRFEL